MSKPLDDRAILRPCPRDPFLEVRGADGRLYARYDAARQLLEVKKGNRVEIIDLKALKRP